MVIVGGGISGLAAAHFYRKATGGKARILILENHDDFGGHAKRNEFRAGDRTLLGYGGTYSIESPEPYSAAAKGVIEELGIEVSSFPKYLEGISTVLTGEFPRFSSTKKLLVPTNWWTILALFPAARLTILPSPAPDAWTHFMAEAPIAEQARKDVSRLCREKKDYLPGLNAEQKEDRLARISYAAS
jgi:spermidine dehydrogenase